MMSTPGSLNFGAVHPLGVRLPGDEYNGESKLHRANYTCVLGTRTFFSKPVLADSRAVNIVHIEVIYENEIHHEYCLTPFGPDKKPSETVKGQSGKGKERSKIMHPLWVTFRILSNNSMPLPHLMLNLTKLFRGRNSEKLTFYFATNR
jgi:hypothetical protein